MRGKGYSAIHSYGSQRAFVFDTSAYCFGVCPQPYFVAEGGGPQQYAFVGVGKVAAHCRLFPPGVTLPQLLVVVGRPFRSSPLLR
eukprot:7570335-Lingulodinium_polyedra.AAC.1